MRLVSWNVNGLRAVIRKEIFYAVFASFCADVFAIQETKMHPDQAEVNLVGDYCQTWSSAAKRGYSGTAVFSCEQPLQTAHLLQFDSDVSAAPAARDNHTSEPDPQVLNSEGRICALEFERFWFVNCYTPNSQDELARIDLRLAWGEAFRRFIADLNAQKPVIICGDFNVAHHEIDLARPSANRGSAGFSDQERADFQALLDLGFTDSFRHLHPDQKDAYTWWSFQGNARANNTGWRIDYFLVANQIADLIVAADIWPEVSGSDHCPVSLEIAL